MLVAQTHASARVSEGLSFAKKKEKKFELFYFERKASI